MLRHKWHILFSPVLSLSSLSTEPMAHLWQSCAFSLSLSLSLSALYTCFSGISIWSMGYICATNETFMLQVRRSLWWLEQESASLQAYQTSALQERAYMTTSRHGFSLILSLGASFLGFNRFAFTWYLTGTCLYRSTICHDLQQSSNWTTSVKTQNPSILLVRLPLFLLF